MLKPPWSRAISRRSLPLNEPWKSRRFAHSVSSALIDVLRESPQNEDEVEDQKERVYHFLQYFVYYTLDITHNDATLEETQGIYDALSEASETLQKDRKTVEQSGFLLALGRIINYRNDDETRHQWEQQFSELSIQLGF